MVCSTSPTPPKRDGASDSKEVQRLQKKVEKLCKISVQCAMFISVQWSTVKRVASGKRCSGQRGSSASTNRFLAGRESSILGHRSNPRSMCGSNGVRKADVKFRSLLRKGIPPNFRKNLWVKFVLNDLNITRELFQIQVARSKHAQVDTHW